MEDRSIIVVDDVVDKPECRQMVIRKVCQCILVERLEPLPIYWVEAEDDASFEIRVLDVHDKCGKDHKSSRMKSMMTAQVTSAVKDMGIYAMVDMTQFKIDGAINPACKKVYRTRKDVQLNKPVKMEKCCLHQFRVPKKPNSRTTMRFTAWTE
jgi:hypothetical protein